MSRIGESAPCSALVSRGADYFLPEAEKGPFLFFEHNNCCFWAARSQPGGPAVAAAVSSVRLRVFLDKYQCCCALGALEAHIPSS